MPFLRTSSESKSTRGMRRAHDRLSKPALSVEQTTGETHRRHHISRDGYYRGKKVLETADKAGD